jgi:uncharacterized protein
LKPRLHCWAIFAVLLITACSGRAQTTQSPLPPPTGYVNDLANVLDQATKDQLETTLTNLDKQQQIQFAVVTVETTGGQDIFDYSRAVARGWGIGSKDTTKPSLLLLIAIKDRKYYTQVSRHLEGDLPDGLVGDIQREKLVPAFRAGDYSGGTRGTVDEYILTLARKQGFSTDTIFGSRSSPPPRTAASRGTSICGSIVFLIVVVVILLVIMRRGGGGSYRGGGWFLWLLLSLLNSGGRSSGSSGWSGGGFGGFGGGGSGGGGFGGFGGGGDFGGGGAGGSW